MKKLLLALLCLMGIVSTQARTVSLDTLNVYSYVLQNNDVLIGTSTNRRAAARIADNATITLQNVNINHMDTIGENAIPGIECLGNATIRLVGVNHVHSMDYDMPGIFVPQGSTLTIEGPGSLEVRATYKNDQFRAPAIGNSILSWTKHSGNIVIRGGTILATSGKNPAIGSGSNSDVPDKSYNQYSCGDITISGGTVTALTGNPNCCAIGARNNSTCGNITITDGVTKVTASRGQNALSTIGKSLSNCACGTITIGGVVYPNGITATPYTYDPSVQAPCNAPTNLSVSNIAQSSATLSWTPGDEGDTQWLVIYGPATGSEDEISQTVTTNPYTLTGLNPGTNYNVWVKTDCGEEYSQFAAYQSFRTEEPAPCNAPTNLSVSNIAQSSATLSWTPGDAGDTQWTILYGPRFGTGNNISLTVTTNPYTLTELTPNTEYSVWVKTNCGGGEYSGYSNYLSFRTEDRTDKTVITACALQGYDGSALEVGTTFTYQLGQTIARAITPINAAAPYTTSLSGGYLYKKDDEGRFMSVADNTVLEAGEYIFAIMLHIIQPEATDYRFPRKDEGITVDVTVDGVTWSANPRNYQDGGASGSSIMAGTPAFTLGSEDDPAEIEAAKSELEDYIDYLEAALQAVEDQTLVAQLIQAKTNAQTVYDNPNATLQEINEAIESCNQALTAAGPTVIEQVIAMYISQFRAQLATYGELSEACQAAADDYITKLEALAYIPTLSYVENLQYVDMKMGQYTKLLEEQFEAYGCEPSEEALDDVQPDKLQGTKLLRDGQLFILVGDKTYNAQGAEVR